MRFAAVLRCATMRPKATSIEKEYV
jgi:hypothetical protein